MRNQFFVILLTTAFAHVSNAQNDSVQRCLPPERPHEIGISILTPLIMVAGATEYNERFTNLTYRYRFTNKHAIRVLGGIAPNQSPYNNEFNGGTLTAEQYTLYPTEYNTTPSNFQLGVGYEHIAGGRLKHGFGADLIYNNKFEKTEHYYTLAKKEADPNGYVSTHYYRLDSASYVDAKNFNKFGLNVFYSLRYEFSRKWFVTASATASFRAWQLGSGRNRSTIYDFNMIGILSDISLFYRF